MRLKLLRDNLFGDGWTIESYKHPILRFQSYRLNKNLSHAAQEGFYIGSKKNHGFDKYNVILKKIL